MQTSTAFSLARTCSERCPVFVWDEDPRRCQELVNALGTVECISAQAHSVPLHEPEEGRVAGAVVALLSSSIAPRDVSLIHELKGRFAFVICCIGAGGDADLCGICRLFLAGASQR